MDPLPITAVVVSRNEARHLPRCLAALDFCAEILLVDMRCTDDSPAIARRYGARVLDHDVAPVVEPVRAWAAGEARHDWVLLVDPDEEYPAALADALRRQFAAHPEAGAFDLPIWFHFKGRALTGTVWGGGHLMRRGALLHRGRCTLSPLCNQPVAVHAGYATVRLAGDAASGNHIRHYWSDSYLSLLHKHVCRYAYRDAQRLHAEGRRFTLAAITRQPWREFWRCFRDFDGWRLGPRGWLLSAIFGLYHVAIGASLAVVQWGAVGPAVPAAAMDQGGGGQAGTEQEAGTAGPTPRVAPVKRRAA